MILRLASIVLVCAVLAGEAGAAEASQDEGQAGPDRTALNAALAANPEPAWSRDPSISRSLGVGRTHDCSPFFTQLRLSENGDVLVRYDVAVDGAISNVTLAASSGHDQLDQAAMACVRQVWRSIPALQGGVPIATPGHVAIIEIRSH